MKEIKENYILHFFPYQKFTESYIEFINMNFEKKEHFFVLYGDINEYVGDLKKILQMSNVFSIYNMKVMQLFMLIKKSKKVIYHFLICYKLFVFIMFIKMNHLGIVFWGADIELLKIRKCSLKLYLKKMFCKIFMRKLIAINLIENDYRVLTNLLNIKFRKYYIATYSSELFRSQVFNMPFHHNESNINILLGNSATITNNHIEIIDKLSRFKNENITIYIPLSYGDKTYGQKIEEYAKKKLGSSVKTIKNFMDPKDYNIFLNSIDIGIFNYHRQQGLGNINRLLTMRKKVYINSRSGLLDYYSQMGIKVYNIDILDNVNFEEFVYYDFERLKKNKEIMISEKSLEKKIKEWNLIFEDNW